MKEANIVFKLTATNEALDEYSEPYRKEAVPSALMAIEHVMPRLLPVMLMGDTRGVAAMLSALFLTGFTFGRLSIEHPEDWHEFAAQAAIDLKNEIEEKHQEIIANCVT